MTTPTETLQVHQELDPPVLMVLLEKPFNLGPSDIRKTLLSVMAEDQFRIQSGKNGSVLVLWREASVAIMSVDHPIPAKTFATQIEHGLTDGAPLKRIVQEHKAHLIVSAVSPAKSDGKAIFNAMTVMHLAGLLVENFSPIGAYWSNSEVLTSWQNYCRHNDSTFAALQAEQRGEGGWQHLPLYFWTSFQIYQSDNTSLGGRINGLSVFFGFNAHIEPLFWPPGDLMERLRGITQYLFKNGSVLKDGDTLGVNEQEKFVVSFSDPEDTGAHDLTLELQSAYVN